MEPLLDTIESTANMLRGMTLDPSIPPHAKNAMLGKIAELETAVELAEKSDPPGTDWDEPDSQTGRFLI